jgi:hypothetical protein
MNTRKPRNRFFRPRPELLEDRRLLTAGTYFEDFTHDSDRILNPPPGHQFRPAWDTSDNDAATFPSGDADSDPNTSLGPDELHIRNDFPWPSNVTNGPTQPLNDGGYASIFANPAAPAGPNILALGVTRELGIARMVFDFPAPGTPGGFAADEEVATASLDLRGVGEVTFVGANASLSITVDTRDSTGARLWDHISAGRNSLVHQGNQLFELGGIQQIIVRTTRTLDINRIGVLVFPKPSPQTNVIANDDYAIVSPRQQFPGVHIDWQRNDLSLDNHALTLVGHTQPLHGSLSMHTASGAAYYEPTPGFLGRDSFEYTLTDGQGNTDRANVIIDVVNNLPPVATPVQFNLAHGTPGPLRGTIAYTDPDGDLATAAELAPAPGEQFVNFPRLGGAVLINVVDGRVEFEHRPTTGAFLGNDRFYISIRDAMGGASEPVLIEIIVPNNSPVAGDKDATGQPHATIRDPILISVPISDPDGDPISRMEIVNAPQHGAVTRIVPSIGLVEYQLFPRDGATVGGFAADHFTYKVIDFGDAESNVASVNVSWVNTEPVARGDLYRARVADDADGFRIRAYVHALDPLDTAPGVVGVEGDLLSTGGNDGVGGAVVLQDHDLDGDPLEVRVVLPPTHGTLQFTDVLRGHFTYEVFPTSPILEGGYDVFLYEVTDGWSVSNFAAVTIYVPPPGTSSWVRPLADHDEYDLPAGGNFNLTPEPAVNDIDVRVIEHSTFNDDVKTGGQMIGARAEQYLIRPSGSVTGAITVGVSGRVSYAAPPGFAGSDRFRYSVEYADDIAGYAASFVTNAAEILINARKDLDGVDSQIEDAAPNGGDGNNDGTLDSEQANVASLPNPIDGQWITLVSALSTWIESAGAFQHTTGFSGVDFPVGIVHFVVQQFQFGQAPTVTLILPPNTRVDSYYKHDSAYADESECIAGQLRDSTANCWYEFLYDGSTGARFFDASGHEVAPHTNAVVSKIVLHFVDEGRGDSRRIAFGNVPPGMIGDPGGPVIIGRVPRVQSVVINDGSAQRSMVNSLTVAFDGLVAVEEGAFELFQHGVAAPLPLQLTLSESLGRTVAQLTFQGPGIIGGSLADGQYRLIIRGDKVRNAAGTPLDGDGDEVAGGDYVDEFFRLFGDADGDGDVDTADAAVIKPAFRKRSSDPGYLWYLDSNADGRVWSEDLALFLLGYARSNRR